MIFLNYLLFSLALTQIYNFGRGHGLLPKWSLPYRLILYGNIFVSQIPTLIPGIKVEFSHSFKKEQQEKSHKIGWILVCFI